MGKGSEAATQKTLKIDLSVGRIVISFHALFLCRVPCGLMCCCTTSRLFALPTFCGAHALSVVRSGHGLHASTNRHAEVYSRGRAKVCSECGCVTQRSRLCLSPSLRCTPEAPTSACLPASLRCTPEAPTTLLA